MRRRGGASPELQSRLASGAASTVPSIGDRIVSTRALMSASMLVVVSIALSGDQPSVTASPRPSATLTRRRGIVLGFSAGLRLGFFSGASAASARPACDLQLPFQGELQGSRVLPARGLLLLANRRAGGRPRGAVGGVRVLCAVSCHGRGRLNLDDPLGLPNGQSSGRVRSPAALEARLRFCPRHMGLTVGFWGHAGDARLTDGLMPLKSRLPLQAAVQDFARNILKN